MKVIFLNIFLFISSLAYGQFFKCDFDNEYINRVNPAQLNQVASRFAEDSTTILKIPVVIHLLHLKNRIGSVNNPTETSIKETIEYLNKSFRATWDPYPDTLSGGTDIRIEFVLATKDTLGRPFNGLNRIDASAYPGYADLGRVRSDLLLSTMWNKFKYFNIWVVHKLEGGGGGVGASPEPANAPIFNYEGVVIIAPLFQPGFSTLVHEAGHYFGLMHTWGVAFANSCPANNNCETDSDFICDTEPHSEFASCQLIGSTNPCTGLPYGNTLKYFMSYSENTCLDRFTRLQKRRMRITTLSLRPGIANNELTIQSAVTLLELNEFRISPNPNNGTFTLHLIAPVSGNLTISIMNSSGQTVFRKVIAANMEREIPVAVNLQGGIYFVSLSDKSGILTGRTFIR